MAAEKGLTKRRERLKLTPEELFEQAQLQEVRALHEAIDRCDDGPGKEYLWAKLHAVLAGLASRVGGAENRMRTPTSHIAMLKAVAHCTHPDIDATDSMLLTYIAMYADRSTGGGSHPGNRNIADALKLTERPAKARIAKNIERGLIERTKVGDGRSKASVYRICWQSPHYPDSAPGGEWLSEKPGCLDDLVSEEPGCLPSKTGLSEQRNRAVDDPKLGCLEPETGLSRRHHIKSTTNTDQLPIQSIPTPPEENRPGLDAERMQSPSASEDSTKVEKQHLRIRWAALVEKLGPDVGLCKNDGTNMVFLRGFTPTYAQMEQIFAQVDEIGPDAWIDTVDSWATSRDMEGLDRPWALWMKPDQGGIKIEEAKQGVSEWRVSKAKEKLNQLVKELGLKRAEAHEIFPMPADWKSLPPWKQLKWCQDAIAKYEEEQQKRALGVS